MADLKQTSNGADYTTYQLNPYLKNRLKYHAASRLASQTGEGLSQAMNVDGHTVTTAKVWAASATAFPNNADKDNVDAIDATNDLVTVFKTSVLLSDGSMSVVEEHQFWAADKNGNKNGKVWTNTAYPAVKLYENVPMTAVKGSDGGGKFQAFEILAAEDGYSEGTLRVSDWVAPTSVADRTTGKVVAGFSGIPKAAGSALTSNAGKWGAALGTWEFVYIAGLLTFEPGYTPQEISANNIDSNTRKSLVSLTAFKYVGEYLADTTEAIEGDITTINKKIESLKVAASGNELMTGTISLTADPDGNLTPVTVKVGEIKDETTGVVTEQTVTITGTVDGGEVTIIVPGEVILVKEADGDVVSPDKDITSTGVTTETTVTADYGNADLPASWSITFRV